MGCRIGQIDCFSDEQGAKTAGLHDSGAAWAGGAVSAVAGGGGDMNEDLLHRRINEAHAEMTRILGQSLYGDDPAKPLPRRTLRERFSDLKWRIEAAWLVLRGKADIC
jgi:hypothetical protein